MVGKINVAIVPGDIATQCAGGCVVPQYRDHGSMTGVAGRLISTECFKAVDDYDLGARYLRYPFGYAVSFPTEGSDKFERLIHVVDLDLPREEAFKLTQLATYSALMEAEKHGLTSVVMPALSTGEGSPLRYSASAAAMLSAIAVFPAEKVRDVTIAIWKSEGAFNCFRRGAEDYVQFMRFSLPEEYAQMNAELMSRRS